MRKTAATIITALLLGQSALANTDGLTTDTTKSELVPEPAVVQPSSVFQNERFQHPRLELAFKGQTLMPGADSDAVKIIQVALIDLGFGLPAGADGDYGWQTKSAVMAFQSSRGLRVNGQVDKATLRSLDKVAPLAGKKIWEDEKSAALGVPKMPVLSGKNVRAVVDLSEHRLTVYTDDGQVDRVYPVASGAWGTATDLGVKVVYDKVADPSPIAWALWPESRGGAFGTRMLDLSWYDPASGKSWGSGEELHGTYARNSIGSNASHGCVRMQNEDVEWVYQNLEIGDIVVVQQ